MFFVLLLALMRGKKGTGGMCEPRPRSRKAATVMPCCTTEQMCVAGWIRRCTDDVTSSGENPLTILLPLLAMLLSLQSFESVTVGSARVVAANT